MIVKSVLIVLRRDIHTYKYDVSQCHSPSRVSHWKMFKTRIHVAWNKIRKTGRRMLENGHFWRTKHLKVSLLEQKLTVGKLQKTSTTWKSILQILIHLRNSFSEILLIFESWTFWKNSSFKTGGMIFNVIFLSYQGNKLLSENTWRTILKFRIKVTIIISIILQIIDWSIHLKIRENLIAAPSVRLEKQKILSFIYCIKFEQPKRFVVIWLIQPAVTRHICRQPQTFALMIPSFYIVYLRYTMSST